MSSKMTCVGCDSHTSAIWQAFTEERDCPNCRLPFAVTTAVLAARQSSADESLIQRFQEAEVRAGKAEAEAARLRRHLAAIQRAVNHEPDPPPDW